MSQRDNLLKKLVPADKEFKVSAVTVFGDPAKFTSQLSEGYDRKAMGAFNNSNSASGENILWGGSDCDTNGMPIPQGSIVDIPVADNLDVYFCNENSGEHGDLRVVELA